MPVAMPVKQRRHRMQDTLLKEAIREERTVENLRRLHEFETFKSIVFQRKRGMSVRSLEQIYGADTVRRCFETVSGGDGGKLDGARAMATLTSVVSASVMPSTLPAS
jgi:hypothetical protein